ncbi:hypothetical protein TNCV_3020661 [Trichonephila clavipes]|nr:hypothetical protein TNCV_3020661 [Trichonephila clavipes]
MSSNLEPQKTRRVEELSGLKRPLGGVMRKSIPPQRVVEKTGRVEDLLKRGQLGSVRRNMMPLLFVSQVLDCGNSICHEGFKQVRLLLDPR